MKRFSLAGLIIGFITVFSYCSSSKKAAVKVPLLTYEANIQQLVTDKCSPCHIPAKGGNKLALDNYDAVKTNIDPILDRIHRMPGEKGFMPFKRPKLSDSAIAVFAQWKTDGMLAK
jgi:hypothetical protein